jgi:RimJ/RimL family protein N-acetyltransferase
MLGNELLQGERIRFTSVERADCVDIARWWSDIEFQRLLRRGEVELDRPEDFEQWLFSPPAHAWEESKAFAIRTLDERKLIGMLEINRIMRQARHCMFWIAIGDPDARGKGYGTEALHILLRFAFLEMNMNRVGLEVNSYNTRAHATYERVGFAQEGVLRETVYRDGVYHDMILMSILRREWEARYWQK